MNMRMTVIGTGLILAMGGLPGHAQFPPHGPGGPGMQAFGRPLVERAEQIGANPEQIKALTEYLFDQREEIIDLRAVAEKAELALDRLLEQTPVDREALSGAIDELNAARGAIFKLELLARIEIQNILGKELSDQLRPPMPPCGMVPSGFPSAMGCGASMKRERGGKVDAEP